MPPRIWTASAAIAAVFASPLIAQDSARLTYPQTERGSVVETRFGDEVADPYRWLENDVRNDPKVAGWVAAQNAVTDGYLAGLPQRGWFAQRIRALMDYERFGLPYKAGRTYFYMRNSGLQNQSQLFVRQGLGGHAAPADRSQWLGQGRRDRAGWLGAVAQRQAAGLFGAGWRRRTGARSRCSMSRPARC